jgi:hypothetical protein
MNAFLEALVVGLTPLNHCPHILPLLLEGKVLTETVLCPDSHANVLELFLNHFLRL